jgi:hypothetical protein
LFQRAFVRRIGKFIDRHLNKRDLELVAINIVLPDSLVAPGHLGSFSIPNFQRRLKYALDAAGVGMALGGVDFSFNEHRNGRYLPIWAPHAYVVTLAKHKHRLSKILSTFLNKGGRHGNRVPRPVKVVPFHNNAFRRSYALKMRIKRRIGYEQIKVDKSGKIRRRRKTRPERLRAAERLELYLHLDKIGLAQRAIFRGTMPIVTSRGFRIRRT